MTTPTRRADGSQLGLLLDRADQATQAVDTIARLHTPDPKAPKLCRECRRPHPCTTSRIAQRATPDTTPDPDPATDDTAAFRRAIDATYTRADAHALSVADQIGIPTAQACHIIADHHNTAAITLWAKR